MPLTSLGQKTDPAMIPALEGRVRKGVMVLSADDNAQQAVQAVHDDLVMRGIARWTVFDIPQALGDPYVVLAADNLGAAVRRATPIRRMPHRRWCRSTATSRCRAAARPVAAAYF